MFLLSKPCTSSALFDLLFLHCIPDNARSHICYANNVVATCSSCIQANSLAVYFAAQLTSLLYGYGLGSRFGACDGGSLPHSITRGWASRQLPCLVAINEKQRRFNWCCEAKLRLLGRGRHSWDSFMLASIR